MKYKEYLLNRISGVLHCSPSRCGAGSKRDVRWRWAVITAGNDSLPSHTDRCRKCFPNYPSTEDKKPEESAARGLLS